MPSGRIRSAERAVGTGRAVPVLTFHSLDDSGSVISTAPAVFEERMRDLHARGFTGVTLGRVVASWRGGARLPERTLAITFDDGYSNVLTRGVPLLVELGFSATIFAVAGLLGERNRWDPGGDVPELRLMDGPQLRELVAEGFEVGGHSMSHPALPGLPAAQLEREVVDSADHLAATIGAEVRSFAYPFGSVDPAARAAVARRYSAACGVRLAEACPEDDPLDLPRLDMYYFRGPVMGRLLGTVASRPYCAARRMGRWMRRRVGA